MADESMILAPTVVSTELGSERDSLMFDSAFLQNGNAVKQAYKAVTRWR
jgi:hypothetical protein